MSKTEQQYLDENFINYIGTSVIQSLRMNAQIQVKDAQLTEVMPEYERRGDEIKRLLEIIDSKDEDIKALTSRDILDIPLDAAREANG